MSSVANAGQNLHAAARNPSAVNGTVTLNQTGNFTWEPQREFRVSNGSGNAYNPRSTALADGGYVVTWNSYENGKYGIYARRYDANGNALGRKFVVSKAARAQASPTITALADGGFLVAWPRQLEKNSSPGYVPNASSNVYARRYDASGNAVGSEFLISISDQGSSQNQPTITALADGGFVVTWSKAPARSFVDDNKQFVGQRYDASSNALGSEFLINPDARGGHLSQTSTIVLADGSFVVTWDSGPGNIYARRYDANANALGSQFLSNPQNLGFNPSITALADGGFVITWIGRDAGSYYEDYQKIYARRYDANANALGSEFLISSNAMYQNIPAITALADGGFVSTWREGYLGNDIFNARGYDANANALGSTFLIRNKPYFPPSYPPTITALADGGFVTIWGNSPSGLANLYAQRYDKVPAPFTQDNNQVTGELGTLAGFNSRPGLSNSVLTPSPSDSTPISTPPPSDSTPISTLPSKVQQQLALSNALCATLSPSANREPLAQGENSERLISTNATGLNCSGQSNSQMHSDAIGKGSNNSTQAPPQEQAYAQMVGEQEYTLTRAMSWKARQAYWNEHSQKQSTLSAQEYANYLNQVGSLSESERVQRYEQLGQQLP